MGLDKGKHTLIHTKKGILDGVDCGTYTVYRGIPYAKPPVGDLRWKPPIEAEPWKGTLHADTFSNICVQAPPTDIVPILAMYHREFYSDPAFFPDMSEDCLYLNIWAPNEKKEEPFPVAFWIHGGAFSSGFGSEMEFDGESYCKRGVILVTINYRLGVFGYFAHPWLTAESPLGISGNYGLMDQMAALKWVYENISAFGGDPDAITVFGQSAGSMSTQALVSSEQSVGMIAGAILQSGISCEGDFLLTPTMAEEEAFGEQFVALSGASSLQELRELTSAQLMKIKNRFDEEIFRTLGPDPVMVPCTDGYLLRKTVKELWAAGEMQNIPYLLGTVTNDLRAVPEDVRAKRPGILMKECERWSLKCEESFGRPAWLYHFAHELPGDEWGAFHSSELWYMFGTYRRSWRPMKEADAKLSSEMITCWTNFIKTGCPEAKGTSAWAPYTKNAPVIRRFE